MSETVKNLLRTPGVVLSVALVCATTISPSSVMSAPPVANPCTADPLPYLIGAHSSDSHDLIAMRCSPSEKEINRLVKARKWPKTDDAKEIVCKFQQVLFGGQKTPEEVEARVQEGLKQLEKEVGVQTPAKFAKEMLDTFGETKNEDEAGPGMRRAFEQIRLGLSEAVKTNDIANLKNAFEALFRYDEDTCEVWLQDWDRTFVKVSSTKWLAQSGPEGACQVVTTETLERNGDLCDWIYKTTITDVTGDNEFCAPKKERLNKTVSIQRGYPLELTCKYFK